MERIKNDIESGKKTNHLMGRIPTRRHLDGLMSGAHGCSSKLKDWPETVTRCVLSGRLVMIDWSRRGLRRMDMNRRKIGWNTLPLGIEDGSANDKRR